MSAKNTVSILDVSVRRGTLLITVCIWLIVNPLHSFSQEDINQLSTKIAAADTFTTETDSLVLVAFYHSTNLKDLVYNNGWLVEPLDSWTGVSLNQSRRVVSLYLMYNGLSGTIPDEIGNLTELREFDMSENMLTGTIPSSIGKLSKLEYLNLGINFLSGPLPIELGNLPNLRYIDLNSNNLNGNVPDSYANNPNFAYFDISLNYFDGLPIFEKYTVNGVYKEIIVWGNYLTFKDLEPNVELLQYYGRDFSQNRIPVAINTVEVLLGDSAIIDIEDITNRDLGGENNLYSWYKDRRFFSGNSSSSSLEISNMNISDTGYYKCIISNSVVPGLEIETGEFHLLFLEGTSLNDSLALVALYDSLNGQNWIRSDNWLTGKLETWYGVTLNNRNRVTKINLPSNNLKGRIPMKLSEVANLEVFAINNNQCTGNLPEIFKRLKYLVELDLSYNQFSGNLPKSLSSPGRLRKLNISHNQFEGVLDPIIFDYLGGLKYIDLSYNNLNGTIPSSITSYSYLKNLNIENNYFTEMESVVSFFIDTLEFSGLRLANNYFAINTIGQNFEFLNYKSKYLPQRVIPITQKEFIIVLGQPFKTSVISLTERHDLELSYSRWCKNGVPISQWTTSNVLYISAMNQSDTGVYYCEFGDPDFLNGELTFRTEDFRISLLPNPYKLSLKPGTIKSLPDNVVQLSYSIETETETEVILYLSSSINTLKAYKIDTVVQTGDSWFDLKNLLPSTKYFYYIKARTKYSFVKSDTFSFTTFPLGQNLISLSEPSTVLSSKAEVSAYFTVNRPTQAILYYSTTSGGKDLKTAPITVNSNGFQYFTLTDLMPGTKYYYHVWASNEYGEFESHVLSFETPCSYILSDISSSDFQLCIGNTLGIYSADVTDYTALYWYPINGEIVSGQYSPNVLVNWNIYVPNYMIYLLYVDWEGCEQILSHDVKLKDEILYVPQLKVRKDDNYLLITNSNDKVVSYQWYHDGVLIPNANTQYYSVPDNERFGTYMVEITTENSCKSKSNLLTFNASGELDEYEVYDKQDEMRISPNPASDKIDLEIIGENRGKVNIQITDAMGRVFYNEQFSKNEYWLHLNLPVQYLQAGLYYIKIKEEGKQIQIKQLIKE